ncbi:hypothetical protein ACIBTV_31340, partial [Micromonospora sp. NPDC049366]|uniref:hypothetical protein n=1 Tax=Micromonospora sp. NPDC049366 TaxID=3364271 RepID=UPI0037A0D93C
MNHVANQHLIEAAPAGDGAAVARASTGGADPNVKGQDEVLSDGLGFSSLADSKIPCWWPGDLR